jgi:hypothetical protein
VSKTKDEPAGSMLPLPLQFLAAWLAVWLGRVLQQEVDYLMRYQEPHGGDRRDWPGSVWTMETA